MIRSWKGTAAERRSLAYHRAIAERIGSDASILRGARERVRAWRQRHAVHDHYVTAWEEILARPDSEVATLLTDASERMIACRQVSPFAGVLDARARWKLWRSAGESPPA